MELDYPKKRFLDRELHNRVYQVDIIFTLFLFLMETYL